MEQRLTETQLQQVVAEVQQLSLRQESELSAAQVREILQELNLPPEFLEDALIQLHRREALKVQQRRSRWIWGGSALALVLILLGTTVSLQQQHKLLSNVTTQRDRITLAQDDGGNLSTISRQANEEVFYRITLSNAPVGEKLALSCKWSDPSGQIVHQNRFQTKEINSPVWNTVCRHNIGSAAPIGTWKVEAFVGDRFLNDATFEVK
jgi:heme exporter protein D